MTATDHSHDSTATAHSGGAGIGIATGIFSVMLLYLQIETAHQ